MEHDNYLQKIKYNLIQTKKAETYYYGHVLFCMRTEWTDKVKTAGVDGKTLFINPVWFLALSVAQAIGLMAHEMLHIILRHITMFDVFNRRVFHISTEHRLWNYAGDHHINLGLKKSNYELPDGGLCDPRFEGMATVEIYRMLHDEYKADPCPGCTGSGIGADGTPCPCLDGDGDVIFIDGNGASAERKAQEIDLIAKKAIIKAGIATQAHKSVSWGDMPSSISRLVTEVEAPKLDFPSLLWNYMSVYKQDDYSYRRPNRRYLSQGLYMPTLYSESLCNLAIVFDLSGSVDDHTTSIFYKALCIVKEQLNPEEITLVQFDTCVFSETVIRDMHDICNLKFSGGGGTYIGPVVEWINKNKPEVTLIFTDGFFSPQQERFESDVIWIIQGNEDFRADQGRIIHHDM
jgi:predicted metal-dependent peptidase